MITWPWQWKRRALAAEGALDFTRRQNETLAEHAEHYKRAAAEAQVRVLDLTAQVRAMSDR